MPDMLVNLLNLRPMEPMLQEMREGGVVIRRAQTFEMSAVRGFVESHFGVGWGDEIAVGYSNKPVTVLIALRDGEIVGFGAYECTRRGFFGPTGVSQHERGKGVGKALLLACLWGMREMGYVYGVIGGAGPTEFYSRVAGATEIPGSVPGIYADPIRRPQEGT